MTDAAIISAGFQSLKASIEIGKALLKMGISAEIKDRIREMNDGILAAQESALASQQHQSALIKQVGELEKQIAELETWNAEAETYKLTNVRAPNHPMGMAFAYAPKEGTHTGEPPHFICANCYQERHKSILQEQTLYPGRAVGLVCPRCSVIVYKEGYPMPDHFGLRRPKGR